MDSSPDRTKPSAAKESAAGKEFPETAFKTQTASPPFLSFVIPCYNGSNVIVRSLNELLRYLEQTPEVPGPHEVIVVDDGSSDGSADRVEKEFPTVRVIRHDANRGKGAAVRTGMLAARGRFRFFIDADLPYDLDALRTMLRYLDFKEYDVCVGSRVGTQTLDQVKRTTLRRIASGLYTSFVGRIVVTGVKDTQCGFKGFRADAADYLFRESKVDNFAFDVEILYLAFKNDMDIKKVPVHLIHDDYSTVSVWRHGPAMLVETFKLPWRYYTGRYRMRDVGQRESN